MTVLVHQLYNSWLSEDTSSEPEQLIAVCRGNRLIALQLLIQAQQGAPTAREYTHQRNCHTLASRCCTAFCGSASEPPCEELAKACCESADKGTIERAKGCETCAQSNHRICVSAMLGARAHEQIYLNSCGWHPHFTKPIRWSCTEYVNCTRHHFVKTQHCDARR